MSDIVLPVERFSSEKVKKALAPIGQWILNKAKAFGKRFKSNNFLTLHIHLRQKVNNLFSLKEFGVRS